VTAVAFTCRTEIVMSEARNAGGRMSPGTVMPGTPQHGDALERGLLIGGKSVPASSGKLADDICPWDGKIYARVPATIVGPLINTRGAQRVSKLVNDAAAKGASLLTGDGAIEGPNGTLIRPVVLTDVRPDMDIFAAEIFGPATVIHPVDSTEAAIDMANDTEYGLTGGVISRDLGAALDVVSRVRSGIIHINDQGIADEPMAPFGGVKDSGYGRFGGTAGIESFTEKRWVTIQHSGRPTYPF
jgi:Aldehyde dehydrogenase family